MKYILLVVILLLTQTPSAAAMNDAEIKEFKTTILPPIVFGQIKEGDENKYFEYLVKNQTRVPDQIRDDYISGLATLGSRVVGKNIDMAAAAYALAAKLDGLMRNQELWGMLEDLGVMLDPREENIKSALIAS